MVPGVLDSTHNFAEYYKAALRLECSWRQDELTWAPPQFTVPGTPADDPDEGALPPNAAAGRDRSIGSSTSVQLCFFACGMCLTYPWNSINAAVSVFTSKLGPSSYILIQMAYYIPALPTLLLQTRYDSKFDVRFGMRATYAARSIITNIGIALAIALFALVPPGLGNVIAVVFAVGFCQALAFGSLCQCASHFSPKCVVVFTCGYQFSPCLVLAVTAWTGFHEDVPGLHDKRTDEYWFTASMITLFGMLTLLAFFCVPRTVEHLAVRTEAQRHQVARQADAKEDGARGGGGRRKGKGAPDQKNGMHMSVPLLELKSDEESIDSALEKGNDLAGEKEEANSTNCKGDWRSVLGIIWPSVMAAYLSFFMGVFVVCLLPYVPSDGGPGAAGLAQRLVFVNLLCNLVGRCLSLIGPLSMALGATPIRILRVVFFRMCFAVPYIIYVFTDLLPRNDALAMLYVGAIVVMAGFVASVVYSSACQVVRSTDRPIATLLVNMGMMSGIYSAVAAAYILSSTGVLQRNT